MKLKTGIFCLFAVILLSSTVLQAEAIQPDSTLSVSASEICSGDTAQIVVHAPESDVLYTLFYELTDDTAHTTIPGLTDSIVFMVTPSVTTSYYVQATRSDTLSSILDEKPTVYLDTTAPEALCLASLELYLDPSGNASIDYYDIDDGSSDNCGIVLFALSESSFTCADLGIHTVTLFIEDEEANLATCQTEVTVLDTHRLSISTKDLSRTLTNPNSEISLSGMDFVESIDNPCLIDTVWLSQHTFTCHDIGVQEVWVYATDENGKTDSASAQLTLSYASTPGTALQYFDTLCSGHENTFWLQGNIGGISYTWEPVGIYDSLTGTLSGSRHSSGEGAQTLNNLSSQTITFVYNLLGVAGNGCQTLDTNLSVLVDPIPAVTTDRVLDTICNNAEVSFHISALTNSSLPTKVHISTLASAHVTGHAGYASVSTPFTLSQTLTNSNTIPEKVVYAITPHFHNDDVGDICYGNTKHFEVWVEPTVSIAPNLLADTVCNQASFTRFYTQVSSHRSSSTTSLSFSVQADVPAAFQSLTTPSDRTIVESFTDSLHNLSSSAQQVRYTATPFLTLSHSTCIGTPVEISLFIEPDPVLFYPIMQDTLCNHTATSLTAQAIVSPTRGIAYHVEALPENPPYLSGYSNVNGLSTADTLIQTLSNNHTQAQQIFYVYSPYLIDGEGLTSCQSTSSDTLIVWVEPDLHPTLTLTEEYLCSEGVTALTLTTDAQATREPRFRYSVRLDDDLQIIKGDTFNLAPSSSITDQLMNVSDSVKEATFFVTAYCRTTFGEEEKCTGFTDSVTVWVDPVVRGTALVLFDTLCNEDYSGLYVESPSHYTHDFRYDINIVNPDTSVVSGHESLVERALSDTTRHQLINHTSTPQSLVYEMTSYSILLNGTLCQGRSDSVSLIIDPYPEISVFASRDTLCHEETLILWINENTINHNTVLYNITIDAVSDADLLSLSGYHTDSYLLSSDSSLQALSNNSSSAQWIQYRYHPHLRHVSDARYCNYDDRFDKTRHIELTPALQSTLVHSVYNGGWNITCHNALTGDVEAQVSGGAYQYTAYNDNHTDFSWSDGQNEKHIFGLGANTYYVDITDHFGCTTKDSLTLTQPPPLTATVNVAEIDCSGGADGEIELHPSGGTPLYHYNWEGPSGYEATSKDIDKLIKGSYFVTITDANYCTYEYPGIGVDAPDPIQWGPTSSNYNGYAISCKNYTDGYLTPDVYGAGPSSLFTYHWTGPEGFEAFEKDIFSLSAGLYTLSVTDTANCSNIFELYLTEPDSLESTIHAHDISCVDDSSGFAIAEVTGGTGVYEYLWCNGSDSVVNIRLGTDTYYLTITDNNACSIQDSVEIGEPLPIELALSVESDYNGYSISCHGLADGRVWVELTNAADSVDYLWNDITLHTPLREGMRAGTYELLVRDDQGCTASGSIVLTEPEPMQLEAEGISTLCHESQDGKAWVSATGGVPGYSYYWDGHGTDSVIYHLLTGLYAVTVSDRNNCSKDTVIEVPCPGPIIIEYETLASSCAQMPDGQLSVSAKGGTVPYTLEVNHYTHLFDSTLYIDELLANKYSLTIIDKMHCSYQFDFIVQTRKDHCIQVYNAFSPNNDGYNDYWVYKNLAYYPPARLEIFDRRGRLVYFSNAYANDWDGTSNGKPVPMGSYYYFLHLEGFNEPISGVITIIR